MTFLSNKKPTIVFFVSSLNRGGLETYLLRFLQFGYVSFDKIVVICKHGYAGELIDDYHQIRGVEVKLLKLSYFNFFNYFRLLLYLTRIRPVSVCDFTGDFSGFTLYVAKIAEIPKRLVFYRGSKYQFKISKLKRLYILFLKKCLKLSATRYLSNSEEGFNYFHPHWSQGDSSKYKVIYNGVPAISPGATRFAFRSQIGFNESDFVIGHVGSFRSAKNHSVIVDVAASLIKRIPQVRFLLVGKGVEKGLSDRLAREGLTNHFVMPGNQKQVSNYLSVMDVFLFPSLNEGQPNALIEALLARVPIVASNIPPISECTPPSVSPCLHPPLNVDLFVQSIFDIYADGCLYDLEDVSSWAKTKFDPSSRFTEFLKELV